MNGINIYFAHNNQIGGTDPDAGNIIAFNDNGVVLVDATSGPTPILGNAIFANAK